MWQLTLWGPKLQSGLTWLAHLLCSWKSFFIMMILLGIDSQFAHVDVPVAAIIDEYPNLFPKKYAKAIVVGGCCTVGFLLGLPILTNGGYHIFNLFNDWVAFYGLLLLAFTFTIAVQYEYQFKTTKFRFLSDIEEMIGQINRPVRYYFMAMWFVGCPVMILFIVGNAFRGYQPMSEQYADDYGVENARLIYPKWTAVIGFLII